MRRLAIVVVVGVLFVALASACGKDESGSADDKAGKGGVDKDKKKASTANRAKATEAREFVKKLYDGARSYYMDPGLATASISGIVEAQFPGPSVASKRGFKSSSSSL